MNVIYSFQNVFVYTTVHYSLSTTGLPFEATVGDVIRFFAPLQPIDIRLLSESNTGRPKGECDVDFTTHQHAEEAMKKDKQNMGQ